MKKLFVQRRWPYIYGEFAPYPNQLSSIGLELLDSAGMRFPHVDGIAPGAVNDLEVMLEHIRVLIIFLGDVLADRARQRDL